MKIDRLVGILSILLQKDSVTAPYLAEKFEVSRRTINRDIETLCQAGIPLVTSQGHGGGISIMDGYRIDKTLLTKTDMQAILTGLKSLDSVSQTNRYQALMDKLHLENPDVLDTNQHIVINLSSWYRQSLAPKIELIQDAISARRLLRFHYCSPAGESDRTIEPYLLVFQWVSWYVWGYCLSKKDFRLFKLNRISGLEALDDTYIPRETPPFSIDGEALYPAWIPITARFSPQAKWRLVDDYGPESFEETADGSLLFSFGFYDKESIFSWILSFGPQAELLAPENLRRELAARIEEMSRPYKK